MRGAFFVDAARQKVRCRGEQCSPVDVWSVRGPSPKADAAQGWRANDVRPYMLYSTKTDKNHVVGANSVRPRAFGQCAAMARRRMQRKVGGRTMFAPTCSTAQKSDKKHVVGAHSVRPRAFGQCAAMARRRMQRKVGGRTMFAPTCSTAQKTDKNHVVGAHSVRPRAFGQCAVIVQRWMQRKVGGRTMFAPTCSTL